MTSIARGFIFGPGSKWHRLPACVGLLTSLEVDAKLRPSFIMSSMHIIRLRHPWEKRSSDANESVRVQIPEPAADASHGALERATYTRFFNRPTGLDASSTVALRIERWQGRLESLSLNGQILDHGKPPLEIDITHRIANRNELVIVLTSATEVACRINGEVNLMIVHSTV